MPYTFTTPSDSYTASSAATHDGGKASGSAIDGSEKDHGTVEKIILRRYDDQGRAEYLIQWEENPDPSNNTWEKEALLISIADSTLKAFEIEHPRELDRTNSGRQMKRQRPNYNEADSDGEENDDDDPESPVAKKKGRKGAKAAKDSGSRNARMDSNPNPNSKISSDALLNTLKEELLNKGGPDIIALGWTCRVKYRSGSTKN